MKEEEIKKQIAEILKANIHYSPQLENYVVHGAIEAIWKLMQEYAQLQSAPAINTQEIVNKLYKTFGTDSGILFGISERAVVNSIVDLTLEYAAQSAPKHDNAHHNLDVLHLGCCTKCGGTSFIQTNAALSTLVSEEERWISTDAFVAACKAVDAISSATGKNGLQTIEQINTFQELLKEQGFSISPIAAQSAPKQDWIKVEDKMPEYNLGVLVFIPEEDFHITSGMWDISNKWVLLDEYRTVGEGEGMENCKVTHWMRLPDYPEGYEYPGLPKEMVDVLRFTIFKTKKSRE